MNQSSRKRTLSTVSSSTDSSTELDEWQRIVSTRRKQLEILFPLGVRSLSKRTSQYMFRNDINSQIRSTRQSAVLPDLQETPSVFDSSRLVDPIVSEVMRNRAWSLTEVKLFLQQYAFNRKDFRHIANALKSKQQADCVEFYYRFKWSLDLNSFPSKVEASLKLKLPDELFNWVITRDVLDLLKPLADVKGLIDPEKARDFSLKTFEEHKFEKALRESACEYRRSSRLVIN